MTNDPAREIAQKLRSSRRIAITSHLRPDGDSICTGISMAMMGELLGKSTAIINRDPTPVPFSGFPEAGRIRIGQIDPSQFDTIVLLECADVPRSGQENLGSCFKINIDHHYSNTPYADINWVNPGASAVGEMVFGLSEIMGLRLTPAIASHLYCAIASDTGSFQFSNTTARAFEVCHQLTVLGANPIQVSEMLYNNNPPEKIRLLGQVLSTLRMNGSRNLAIVTMFKRDLESLNLKEIDTEDITTHARSIKGVEMVLFFKEMGQDTFRVSLRSKGRANAAQVAEHFGGGGHIHASGFTAYGPYDRLIEEVPAIVENLLRRQAGETATP